MVATHDSPLTRRYFQDIDPATLDITQHATFIIERLLEDGDGAAVTWLGQTYPVDQLKAVVRSSRRISPKSANYFALKYGIPTSEVRCLTPSYRQAHAQRWPH